VKFTQMDWSTWKPRETATLMFVRMDGMVLLIRKLKGMGAGLINAPAGGWNPAKRRPPARCARRRKNFM
jgi:8-oxo-dGTP diphosphatase